MDSTTASRRRAQWGTHVRIRQAVYRFRWPGMPALTIFVAGQLWVAYAFHDIGTEWPHSRVSWDGNFYRDIAADGYPKPTPDGSRPADFEHFAFYPLYPLLVRALSIATSLPFDLIAPMTSLACATVAVGLIVTWMHRTAGPAAAFAAVAGLVIWPSVAVFQMAYTEGLATLLLVACLWTLAARRYAWFALFVVALSLTRALGVVLGVVALVHLVTCMRDGARGADLKGPTAAAALALSSAAIWPALAGLAADDPLIYLDAHRAFRRHGTPMSVMEGSMHYPLLALGMVAVLVITTVCGLFLLPSGIPQSVRTFLVVYPAFIFATALISTSLVRYFLLIAFPLGLVLEPTLAHRWWRWVALVVAAAVALAGSWWWVHEFGPPLIDGTLP